MRLANFRADVVAALARTPAVETQTRAVAKAIRDEARANAPHRTGRLARSIQVERVVEQGAAVYRVGWDKHIAGYGGLVERGTNDTRAQPHLLPAAEKYNNR